jgi:hypothetical protein
MMTKRWTSPPGDDRRRAMEGGNRSTVTRASRMMGRHWRGWRRGWRRVPSLPSLLSDPPLLLLVPSPSWSSRERRGALLVFEKFLYCNTFWNVSNNFLEYTQTSAIISFFGIREFFLKYFYCSFIAALLRLFPLRFSSTKSFYRNFIPALF